MTRKRASIRTRLLLWSMGALSILSFLLLWEMLSNARIAANEANDRVLLGSALAISDRVLIVDGELEVDIPFISLEMLASTSQDRVFYQVSTQGNQFVTGYNDLPPVPESLQNKDDQPVFYDANYNGETIRVGVVDKYISSPNFSTRYEVKVAETTQARDQLLNDIIVGAITRLVAMIVVVGAILWFGVSWGLRPISKLREALHRRTPNDLRPIEHEVPSEVQHLVDGINDLMSRLSGSIESMRRFTANAAHQLRTPLAAIQTQTELALQTKSLDELETRFGHLKKSTRQSTRLINQLLSLAQASTTYDQFKTARMNLLPLCQEITSEMVPIALKKNIDLGFECELETIFISGEADLLKEALLNLIDNSITYCPSGSTITVRIKKDSEHSFIEVEDNGPGIPNHIRDTIFERFTRGSHLEGDGCGLGLSIVKEIIEHHRGEIDISVSTVFGTKISLMLPNSN